MTVPDPYRVLQVDPSAGADVIEAAYKRLAKKYHPDVAPGPEAQHRMVQLNLARDILRDPVRRAAVDRARVRSHATTARMAADAGRAHASSPASTSEPPRSRMRPAQSAPGDTPPPVSPERRSGHSPGWPFPGMVDPSTSFGERTLSRWTPGGSTEGSAHDPASTGTRGGYGAAGPPPGNPTGSILTFGRYSGWTLGEIARVDLEYLEWLDRTPIGRTYVGEIDKLLRAHGRRDAGRDPADTRQGLYRRR